MLYVFPNWKFNYYKIQILSCAVFSAFSILIFYRSLTIYIGTFIKHSVQCVYIKMKKMFNKKDNTNHRPDNKFDTITTLIIHYIKQIKWVGKTRDE